MLSEPLVAEQSEISRALQARREHRDDSREQGDSNFNPEHRRTSRASEPGRMTSRRCPVRGLRLSHQARAQQFAFGKEPVVDVLSVSAPSGHEQLVRTLRDLLWRNPHHMLRAAVRLLNRRGHARIGGCWAGGRSHGVPLLRLARADRLSALMAITIVDVLNFGKRSARVQQRCHAEGASLPRSRYCGHRRMFRAQRGSSRKHHTVRSPLQ